MDRLTHETVSGNLAEPGGDARDNPGTASGRRGGAVHRAGAGAEVIVGLERAIDEEILPRLVQRHRRAPDAAGRPAPPAPTVAADDVAAFARIAMEGDLNAVFVHVNRLRGRAVPLDSIYLDLLEPAARLLGELWDADRIDFTDVTVGVGRLQRVLRDLNAEFRGELECARQGRRLLLVPAPGEQHTFGLFIVEEFFARAGWDVWGGPCAPGDDVFRLVRDEWFDVVGLSVGRADRLDALAESIRGVRVASRNRAVGVLVGGPVFIEHPEYAVTVGADGTAADGRQAPVVADALVARQATRA